MVKRTRRRKRRQDKRNISKQDILGLGPLQWEMWRNSPARQGFSGWDLAELDAPAEWSEAEWGGPARICFWFDTNAILQYRTQLEIWSGIQKFERRRLKEKLKTRASEETLEKLGLPKKSEFYPRVDFRGPIVPLCKKDDWIMKIAGEGCFFPAVEMYVPGCIEKELMTMLDRKKRDEWLIPQILDAQRVVRNMKRNQLLSSGPKNVWSVSKTRRWKRFAEKAEFEFRKKFGQISDKLSNADREYIANTMNMIEDLRDDDILIVLSFDMRVVGVLSILICQLKIRKNVCYLTQHQTGGRYFEDMILRQF